MAELRLDSLPLGFRFAPKDEELINHYLKGKITGRQSGIEVIREVDLCKYEPWELPAKSIIKNEDPEWFFFCHPERKYPNGKQSNRATEAGYWKPTGPDRKIMSSSPGLEQIGIKKTLRFHKGRAPNGKKTNWTIHEYQANENVLIDTNCSQDAFVICRLFINLKGQTESPSCNRENMSCDVVDRSGLSPASSKSFPEINSSMDTEDPTLENGIPAVTESGEPVDIHKFLSEMADNGTPDLPNNIDTNCSNYMDASGSSFAVQALNSYVGLVSCDGGLQFNDGCHQTGNLDSSYDANADQEVSSEDWQQWVNFEFNEHPEERTVNSVEGVGDTGIKRRNCDDRDETDSDTYPPQGSARRRIRLQMNMIQSCTSDSEDHEDDAEATEIQKVLRMMQARGSIIEPVHYVKHERFPEQVACEDLYVDSGLVDGSLRRLAWICVARICRVSDHDRVSNPAENPKHIRTCMSPTGKAALHQEDYGEVVKLPNQSVKEASSPGHMFRPRMKTTRPKASKKRVEEDPSLQPEPAISNSKTRSAVIFCLAFFIIILVIWIIQQSREASYYYD